MAPRVPQRLLRGADHALAGRVGDTPGEAEANGCRDIDACPVDDDRFRDSGLDARGDLDHRFDIRPCRARQDDGKVGVGQAHDEVAGAHGCPEPAAGRCNDGLEGGAAILVSQLSDIVQPDRDDRQRPGRVPGRRQKRVDMGLACFAEGKAGHAVEGRHRPEARSSEKPRCREEGRDEKGGEEQGGFPAEPEGREGDGGHEGKELRARDQRSEGGADRMQGAGGARHVGQGPSRG